MTRAQRIIRFTFWMNNFYLAVTGVLIWGFTGMTPLWIVTLFTLSIAVVLGFSVWYMKKYFGVVHTSGLYFVDDEREKSIALRVHNTCLMTFIYATG